MSSPPTFKDTNDLPYLQAVIREALRMHPAVGLLLERVVPAGGFEIDGFWLPEGTIIGANPWVMARDEKVFGPDAYSFRPERWLEASPEELRLMDRNDFSFGAGARTCCENPFSFASVDEIWGCFVADEMITNSGEEHQFA